ncbi:hypothetical protein LG290_00655 [Halomonas sediminis]
MSDKDQAAGLRKWANLQRQQKDSNEEAASDAPAPPAQPKVRLPLVVVGLPGTTAAQAHKVKERLSQWAALGRKWAGDPEQWEIHVVAADAPEVATLTRQYRRWALWVESDAEAFVQAFRILRLLHDAGGPRRLLALHEPGLSRRGLLDNLHEAAHYYLGTDLLVLAR